MPAEIPEEPMILLVQVYLEKCKRAGPFTEQDDQ